MREQTAKNAGVGEAAYQNLNIEERFLTSEELLARLPISRRTMSAWVARGWLPAVRVNRKLLFHWPSVEKALLQG